MPGNTSDQVQHGSLLSIFIGQQKFGSGLDGFGLSVPDSIDENPTLHRLPIQ